MKEQALQTQAPPARPARGAWRDRLARRAVLSRLGGLRHGRLTVIEGAQQRTFGQAAGEAALEATVRVRDPAAWRRVAFGGTIGAGEAYMDGQFDCDDLTALVRLFVANREVMQGMEGGWARLRAPAHRLAHALRLHTRAGSRRNITAHYDQGNDFFALFLDQPYMLYSAGIFARPDATLEEAQVNKLERICRLLRLEPDHHVLDIGGGWGGFAIYAALWRGCRVTMTTISPAQYALARERVAQAGLEHRITVLQQDYRDLQGRYDRIVSIEMIEAIGPAQYEGFFAACERLLTRDGLMLLQAITIDDRLYAEALRSVDFIQRYIFPGGALPCVSALTRAVARASGLRFLHLGEYGAHYGATLRHWRRRLQASREAARGLGYSERFLRMWDFYLGYCEGGFLEGSIGLVHLLLGGSGRAATLPAPAPGAGRPGVPGS